MTQIALSATSSASVSARTDDPILTCTWRVSVELVAVAMPCAKNSTTSPAFSVSAGSATESIAVAVVELVSAAEATALE